MSAADEAADGGPEEDVGHEETLRIMKLTSEKERDMFEKVLEWWEGRNLRLSIPVEPEVGAALITRILFAHGLIEPPTDSPTNLHSKVPPFVSPEETSPLQDDQVESVVVATRKSGRAKKIKDSVKTKKATQKSRKDPGMRNQFLVSLASDLATLLAFNAGKEVVKATMPTVAYIASAYYFKFRGKNETKPTEIATEMIKVLVDEETSDEEILLASLLLQKTLLALSRAAKASVETYSDFEFLWTACAANPAFRDFMAKVQDQYDVNTKNQERNENGKRPSDAAATTQERRLLSVKELCWKLVCLVEEKEQELKGGYVSKRRRRILNTASCLGLVSSLACLTPSPAKETFGDKDKSQSPPDGSHSPKRPRIEEDAIDALSMMIRGRESPGQQLVSEGGMDVMEIIKIAVNDLYSSLRPTFQNQKRATIGELEHSAMHTLEVFASAGLILSSKNNTFDVDMEEDEEEATVVSSDNKVTSSFALKMKPLFATKAKRARLVDADAIDEAISCNVKKTVDGLDNTYKEVVSFDELSFVDEASLVSGEVNVMPFLCTASMKASSSGVALISQYDEVGNYSSDSIKAAAIASLAPDAASGRAMRETMDMNEWTASILSISDVRPRTRLILYLEASDDESVKKKRKRPDGVTEEVTTGGGWSELMIPLLNRVIERLIDDIPQPGEEITANRRVSVSEKDGAVLVHGDEEDVEVKLVKALLALYYQSLESILHQETARLKSASHPKLIMNELFHRAALTCCLVCLMKGLCSSSALALSEKFLDLDLPCIQQIMESCPYTYLKVSESFARALKLYHASEAGQQSLQVLGLPRMLQRQLSQCEVMVIDSLLWSQERDYSLDLSVMDIIADIKNTVDTGGRTLWPPDVLEPTLPEEIADCQDSRTPEFVRRVGARPPDHLYFSYIVRKLLKVAFFRISALCIELSIPPTCPVASQVWVAFRYLLRHKIELLYDHHVDQLILCTMYGVCKIMKVEPELTFSKIIEVYTTVRGSELGERACHRIVRHIKLNSHDQDTDDTEYGNIIQFYNVLFVPALKNHLLKSKSLKKAILQLKEYMANPDKSSDAKPPSSEDSEAMAARADKLAKDSGNWANEQLSIPVKEGNVKLNILVREGSGNTFDSEKARRKRKAAKGKADASAPDNRTFFSFGGASTQNITLMNRMAEA